jgi:hypothetical protein
MRHNYEYYDSLKLGEMNYPNPSFNQIELDLRRTFQDESTNEQVEEMIIPLKNVLCTYTKRNPTVGYC